MYCIATDAQNLGIVLLKPAVCLPEEGGLAGSTRGEIKDVEGKHHGLVATVLAQGYISMLWRGQLEIWGYVANFCRHNLTPSEYGVPPSLGLYPTIVLAVILFTSQFRAIAFGF